MSTATPPTDRREKMFHEVEVNQHADIETVRDCITADLSGEEFDVEEGGAAAARLGITKQDFSDYVEALRTAPELEKWDTEYPTRLAAADDQELNSQKELVKLQARQAELRNLVARARVEREMLIATGRQLRAFRTMNPFLYGSLEQAAKSLGAPALTMEEVSRLNESRDPELAAVQLRQRKLAARNERNITGFQNSNNQR